MGRNSGGGGNGYAQAGTKPIGVNSNGKVIGSAAAAQIIDNAESISKLPDREVVKQLQRGISRYEKVMGLRERTIMIAPIDGAYGVTFLSSDGSQGIYLSKQAFSGKRHDVEGRYRRENYDTGFKNLTNRPIQHTITHELAHATWTSSYTGARQVAAGKEIRDLYHHWSRDKGKSGYGRYGASNVDEFWAEVVTKAIHGNPDRYTRRAVAIAKKYKL